MAKPTPRDPSESFHSQHAPLGACASFTVGLVGGRGGFGHALRGPARQNVYVGFRPARSRWRILPFFASASSGEANFTGEPAQVTGPRGVRTLGPRDYERRLGWASDTWRADEGRFGFGLLSPFGPIAPPARLSRAAARLAFSPHINGWIEYDNRAGHADVQLIFGLGDPDEIFRPLADGDDHRPGFALGTHFAYATVGGRDVEPRQGFDVFEPRYRDYRGLSVLGGESALVFTVRAGTRRRFPLVLAGFRDGVATTGIATRYLYTRYFRDLGEVVAHGLAQRRHYARLAAARDRELAHAGLSVDQQFLIAQATHSYLGSTQLLWDGKEPVWVVNEGEYRMMNTFDLTVDHLFFELRFFPWAVANVLDRFATRYRYTDRIRIAPGQAVPGGISFTHDMGVHHAFTPPGRSAYECDHLRGCFSHMTMEQLLNWILCAGTYGLRTGDLPFLRKHAATLRACARSLRRRDHPDPRQRDGVPKHDTLRGGFDGAEITTYDSLDASLGQARQSLYLAVKAWGAWGVLAAAFRALGDTPAARAAVASADQLANTLMAAFDGDTGTFPASLGGGTPAHILPAIEGLAYPQFLGLRDVVDRAGRFAPLLDCLSRHLRTVLRPGVCLDAVSGAWKISSTSTNTWFSKIAIAQYVAREVFPEALSVRAKAADRVHARWQRSPACGAFALCDQVRSDTGIACGSRFYPRGVTSVLWLAESASPRDGRP